MSNKFKVGDKIVLDVSSFTRNNFVLGARLTEGKVYTVDEAPDGKFILITDNKGSGAEWFSDRFKLAPAAPSYPFKMGDKVRSKRFPKFEYTVAHYVETGHKGHEEPCVVYANNIGFDYAKNMELVPDVAALAAQHRADAVLKGLTGFGAGVCGKPLTQDFITEYHKQVLEAYDAAYPLRNKDVLGGSVTGRVTHPKATPVPAQFWIVAVLSAAGEPLPAKFPVRHLDAETARGEAERLATRNQGETFVTLMVTEAFHMPKPIPAPAPQMQTVKF